MYDICTHSRHLPPSSTQMPTLLHLITFDRQIPFYGDPACCEGGVRRARVILRKVSFIGTESFSRLFRVKRICIDHTLRDRPRPPTARNPDALLEDNESALSLHTSDLMGWVGGG